MVSVDVTKNLLFGYLTCKRLFPNYVYFSKENHFGDENVFVNYLNGIRDKIIDPDLNVSFENYQNLIDKNTPLPHEFESVLASSALDFCTSIYELISFIEDEELSRIETIATLATDSVDMYIQVKEDLEISDPKFEEKISSHPLMVKERKVQLDIWNYLNKVEAIEVEDVVLLEKLQYNNGLGNLDLQNK